MTGQNYIAVLHKDKGSDYGVSFPDFPGCVTAGTTLDEAKDMAAEALAGHIAAMIDAGYEIPDPSSLETVMRSTDFSDGVAFLVSAIGPDKTVRFNVTAPSSALDVIDRGARASGLSRSAFLVQAAMKEARTHSSTSGSSK